MDDNIFFNDIDVDVNHLNTIFPDFQSQNQSSYYDSNKFNTLLNHNNDNFSILNLNIRSLTANIDILNAFLCSLNIKFDVLCLTESWLNSSTKDLIHMNNYNSVHSLRPFKRGGGVSIFINNNISYKLIESCSLSLPYIESLFVILEYRGKRVIIATIYRPPNSNHDLFINKLNEIIYSCNKIRIDEFILCGDFNYNLFESDDNNVMRFHNTLNSFSLIPVISKPTRIAQNSATLIDNICLRNPIDFIAGLFNIDISDHLPIFLIKENFFQSPKPNQCKILTYRLINDDTIDLFRNNVAAYNFNDIIDTNDCTVSVTMLEEVLHEIYNNCCPIKTKVFSPKRLKKPWINNEILLNIKKRQNYFNLFKLGKISVDTYNRFRNNVTSQIRNSKKNYYLNLFEKYKSNTKATWHAINNILKPQHKSKAQSIKKLLFNNIELTENIDIANALNSFFCNIGTDISQKYCDNLIHRENYNHLSYLKGNYCNSFFFKASNPREINSIIKSLKNKRTNLKSIPISILKTVSEIISPVISNIINKSIESCHFPDVLKIARVTPIYKSGDKDNINNYRPISVLPLLSKIFEKYAYNLLYKYLEDNQILYKHQYGFRKNMSTNQAILNHLQYLYDNLDSGHIIFSIFLDFRKAFDCVDHKILLSKLNYYGVRGNALGWFESYLSNRKQAVVVDNFISENQCISHGVPQGSILGPLLFLIFINDIYNSNDFFKFILFADDSTLSTILPSNSPKLITKTLNFELSKVNKWLVSNKICINEDKTKYIIFSYKRKIKLSTIKIGKNKIKETDHTKFLGIFIDNKLTFRQHANYLRSKISKSIGVLYKLNKFLPISILSKLYSTLVFPYFLYCIEAWHSAYENVTKPLVILQKKSIRAICNLNFRDHTNHHFKSLSILKLNDLHKYQTLIYFHKSLNRPNFDPTLHSYINDSYNIHNHPTRKKNTITPICYNLNKSKFNIKHSGPKLFNTLPSEIKNTETLYKFKKQLKNYFLTKY